MLKVNTNRDDLLSSDSNDEKLVYSYEVGDDSFEFVLPSEDIEDEEK